jgi:hypothetical protein
MGTQAGGSCSVDGNPKWEAHNADGNPFEQSLNSIWSIDDRAKWLKAAAMAFNLVYRTREESSSKQKPEQTSSVLKSVG